MTRKTTEFFYTAVSDKDFIFGVFPKNGFGYQCGTLQEESVMDVRCGERKCALWEDVQNGNNLVSEVD